MPRFQPDFGKTEAGFPVYPRGDYEIKVTKVSGFLYNREDEETGDVDEVSGVTASLEMVGLVGTDGSIVTMQGDKTIAGEKVAPVRLYVHSEAAWPIAKRFAMAAYGYDLDTEKEFNAFIGENDLDFSVDGEIGEDGRADEVEIGDGWAGLEGKRLRITLSQRTFNNRAQQDHGGFMPIK